VNFRLEAMLYETLAMIARQERRSIAQTARQLLEEGLHSHLHRQPVVDDTSGQEIAPLAMAGGAFDWLAEEPEIYDDTCGEGHSRVVGYL
jgi:hypothetical protein